MTRDFAGKLVFTALTLAVFITPTTQAQNTKQPTDPGQASTQIQTPDPTTRPRTVTVKAVSPNAEPGQSAETAKTANVKADDKLTVPNAKTARADEKAPTANDKAVRADEKTAVANEKTAKANEKVTPAVEAAVQQAVVPPPPNVMKRNPNTISIPADALDKGHDYEEQPTASVSVGSRFGIRRDPFTRRSKFHSGVDIKARWGDPVGASHPGTVTFVGWYHGYGNMVIVDHGGNIATHYAHLSSFDVEVGEHVDRGTIIGRAGSTGRATSPHLHYEVRVDGNAVNPFSTLMVDPDSGYFKQTNKVVAQPTKTASKETVAAKKPADEPPAAKTSQADSGVKLKEQH